MPSMNGAELLDKVNPDVKRILVSAFDMHDDLFTNCRSINIFLSKPIQMSELIREVQQHVNKLEIKQNYR
jgi:response regulator RpfG family c-di-GMP phosphodiesterase